MFCSWRLCILAEPAWTKDQEFCSLSSIEHVLIPRSSPMLPLLVTWKLIVITCGPGCCRSLCWWLGALLLSSTFSWSYWCCWTATAYQASEPVRGRGGPQGRSAGSWSEQNSCCLYYHFWLMQAQLQLDIDLDPAWVPVKSTNLTDHCIKLKPILAVLFGACQCSLVHF